MASDVVNPSSEGDYDAATYKIKCVQAISAFCDFQLRWTGRFQFFFSFHRRMMHGRYRYVHLNFEFSESRRMLFN